MEVEGTHTYCTIVEAIMWRRLLVGWSLSRHNWGLRALWRGGSHHQRKAHVWETIIIGRIGTILLIMIPLSKYWTSKRIWPSDWQLQRSTPGGCHISNNFTTPRTFWTKRTKCIRALTKQPKIEKSLQRIVPEIISFHCSKEDQCLIQDFSVILMNNKS